MNLSQSSSRNQAEIENLFIETFSDSEGLTEGKLLGRLVKDLMKGTAADDLYCFIASENTRIVGCIFFSRMTFENSINAFILAPVATHPEFQGRGIGQKLIKFGLNTLSGDGVELVLTYGDPDFYSKVGFNVITEKTVPAPLPMKYPAGWQAQSLTDGEIDPIAGKSHCVKELNKPEYW